MTSAIVRGMIGFVTRGAPNPRKRLSRHHLVDVQRKPEWPRRAPAILIPTEGLTNQIRDAQLLPSMLTKRANPRQR